MDTCSVNTQGQGCAGTKNVLSIASNAQSSGRRWKGQAKGLAARLRQAESWRVESSGPLGGGKSQEEAPKCGLSPHLKRTGQNSMSLLSQKGRAKTTERAQVGTEVTQPGVVQRGQMEVGVSRAKEVDAHQASCDNQRAALT